MNTATAVAIADDLPDQGWVGSCEIIRFPNPGMVSNIGSTSTTWLKASIAS